MGTKEIVMNILKTQLKTYWPDIVDLVSETVQSKTSPELDRWVRIGAAGIKAAGTELFKEFGI